MSIPLDIQFSEIKNTNNRNKGILIAELQKYIYIKILITEVQKYNIQKCRNAKIPITEMQLPEVQKYKFLGYRNASEKITEIQKFEVQIY